MLNVHQISVWFVCKLCRSSFQTVPDLIKHKFESHFEQFKSVKHIIFEERFYDCDLDFPDGYRDHLTKSKPFDEGQVYGDRFVSTIQRPTLPLINSTYIKSEDASVEDKKPFTLSSNLDLLDNINSRTVSFTIEQDSVIINVGTLNNLNSAATISERVARPFDDIIGKEKKVRDASSRIQNPFVLLKRLSPQDIKNAKLGNGNVTKFDQSCSCSDVASFTDSIDFDFDQLSVTSKKVGTNSNCEIDFELDVKPFKQNEESTLSNQNLSNNGTRRKCEKLFQHSSQTLLGCDGGNSNSSAPVLAATPAICTINSGESQRSQNIDEVIHINSAKNSLRLGKESAIFFHKQFICPHPNCKMPFKKEANLTKHVNYYHGDLERRRRLIASGSPTYGSNNDKMDMNTLSESRSPSVHPVSDTHSDCNIEETRTRESNNSDENELDLKIKQIIRDIYAETALREEQKRTIEKQTLLQKRTIVKQTPSPFACPRQKCKSVFKDITSVKRHLNYFHGDLERRRVIASGCQTYGSNDDDKNADCGTPCHN